MRVAYILPSLQEPSGWRTLTIALIQHIKSSIEPIVIVPQEYKNQARREFSGLPVFTLPTTQQYSLASQRGISRLLESRSAIRSGLNLPQVDIVHSLEAYPTGLVGVWLAKELGVPHVFTSHGTYSVIWSASRGGIGIFDRWGYLWVLRNTRAIFPVSDGTANMIQRYYPASSSHIEMRTILPGNDFYQRIPRQQALEHNFNGHPTLLSVGDLKPRKGQHFSLAAFAKVKTRFPEARYWIVGSYSPEQPYFQQMQQFVAEYHLTGVQFLGAISDKELSRCYREATLFVLTPQEEKLNFEGFGLVYLEAGAYGLPVVATRTGGVPNAVLDGETGILVEQGDIEGIAAAILSLVTNPQELKRMGSANRTWSETLTWQHFAAEHLQAYQEILAR